MAEKTHKLVSGPQMTARQLADFMEASEQKRRTIVRDCKYQRIVQIAQHKIAKVTIGSYFRNDQDYALLAAKLSELKSKEEPDAFKRDVLNKNIAYLERFSAVRNALVLPKKAAAEGGDPQAAIDLGGVKVNIETVFRLEREAATTRIGIATLRYESGKELKSEVGNWQSALIWGALSLEDSDESIADKQLCLTMDIYGGVIYAAPNDSKKRLREMKAACHSISERWDKVEPPASAVL